MRHLTYTVKSFTWCFIIGCLFTTGRAHAETGQDASSTEQLRKSVVNITATTQQRDPMSPWRTWDPEVSVGSGVVIAPGRVLTNAHVVDNAINIMLDSDQLSLPVTGTLIAYDWGRDLALIETTDQSFIDAHPWVGLQAGLPADGEEVVVMGYPIGGTAMSVTTGVVSRCQWDSMPWSQEMMVIQVDAAINSGNSGGPCFVGSQIAGLSFASGEGDDIGYAIAAEEIDRFLREADAGAIDGNTTWELYWQNSENPALRQHLGVPDDASGIVVLSDDQDICQPWDVITNINGFDLTNSGEVVLEGGRRTYFRAAAGRFDPLVDGETFKVEVLRRGVPITLRVQAKNSRNQVIPKRANGDFPYIVIGPLVFGPLHVDLWKYHLDAEVSNTYFERGSPIGTNLDEQALPEGKEFVALLTDTLGHPIAGGYYMLPGQTLKAVNDRKVVTFSDFVKFITSTDDEWLVFEFNEANSDRMVFNRQALFDATEDVLEDNGIRHATSKAFRHLWPPE